LLTLIGVKHVENACDGESALQALRQSHFGLVISDWNMLPISGQTFLQRVRSDLKAPAAVTSSPVISVGVA